MAKIAETRKTPYYAVIFTSERTDGDNGYSRMSEKMVELVAGQPGFLGFESARDKVGITVSYWKDLESIKAWKENPKHKDAQKLGKEKWYSSFRVRIARGEHDDGLILKEEK